MVAAVFRQCLAGKRGLFAALLRDFLRTMSAENRPGMRFSGQALILRAQLLSIGLGDCPEEKSNIRNNHAWEGRNGWMRIRGGMRNAIGASCPQQWPTVYLSSLLRKNVLAVLSAGRRGAVRRGCGDAGFFFAGTRDSRASTVKGQGRREGGQ
jgi:hypothetical protein